MADIFNLLMTCIYVKLCIFCDILIFYLIFDFISSSPQNLNYHEDNMINSKEDIFYTAITYIILSYDQSYLVHFYYFRTELYNFEILLKLRILAASWMSRDRNQVILTIDHVYLMLVAPVATHVIYGFLRQSLRTFLYRNCLNLYLAFICHRLWSHSYCSTRGYARISQLAWKSTVSKQLWNT